MRHEVHSHSHTMENKDLQLMGRMTEYIRKISEERQQISTRNQQTNNNEQTTEIREIIDRHICRQTNRQIHEQTDESWLMLD